MTNKDIIEGGLNNFESLIEFIKKPIEFDEIEPHRFKAVVDGRKTAFESASSQLTKIKQLEEGQDIFNEEEYRVRLEKLVESTENIWDEIKKVLNFKINADALDDDKVKSFVQAKDMSFELMRSIISVKNGIERRLDSDQSLASSGNRNFASERFKPK